MEQNEELSSEIRSEQPFVHVQKDVAKSSPEAVNIHTAELRNHICKHMVMLFMYLTRKYKYAAVQKNTKTEVYFYYKCTNELTKVTG